jgi:hypothetical protein
VQASYERILLDPRENDRMLVAHVILNACLMAAPYLLPAIDVAFESGRVDTDVVDLDSVRMEMVCRHHRPDAETKDTARRDVREDYLTWDELVGGLAAEDRERLERLMARLDRADVGPPRPGDEPVLWAGELGYPEDGSGTPDDEDPDDDDP